MPRPAGKRLNGGALRDVIRLKGLSLTDAAQRCDITLATLSGLVSGRHRASNNVIRKLQLGLELENDSTLFPDLAGWVYVDEDKGDMAVAS